MTYTVTNEQGAKFLVVQTQFDDYEIFEMARKSWPQWEAYTVTDTNNKIVIQVVNPENLTGDFFLK
jgi:hypothetical protein